MTLHPTPVSTSNFSHTHDTRGHLLVAEASSLPPMTAVYDDACDEGYTLVSTRTGRELVIAVDGVTHDNDGDLCFWTLRPVNPAERDLITVRVYND